MRTYVRTLYVVHWRPTGNGAFTPMANGLVVVGNSTNGLVVVGSSNGSNGACEGVARSFVCRGMWHVGAGAWLEAVAA
eukprot:scaffold318717_cov32-Tisochrysis_lutea.AAC.2